MKRSFSSLSGCVSVLVLLAVVIPSWSAGADSKKSDTAKAKSELLVKSDFPTGWTTSKSTNPSGDAAAKGMAACLHVPVKKVAETPPTAYSPNFIYKPASLIVNDKVQVFKNKEQLMEKYSFGYTPKAIACQRIVFNDAALKAEVDAGAPKGIKFGTMNVKSLPKPKISDRAWAEELSEKITYEGHSYNSNNEIIFIAKGDQASVLTFESDLGVPFPSGIILKIEKDAAAHLSAS